MQTYKQLFQAGKPTNLPYRGNTFIIQSSDQGNSVKVDFVQNGATVYDLQNVGPGLKARPVLGFDGLVITATVDTNLQFIVSDGDIELQITQQTVTVANQALPVGNGPSPLHVTVDGTVAVSGATLTATNVGINNTNANPVPVSLHASDDTTAIPVQVQPPASAPSDISPVNVTAAGVPLIAANAARKGLRIRNAGTGMLAITAAAATTYANAAVVLRPGDLWVEAEAPQAAWYAISDVGTTANVQAVA